MAKSSGSTRASASNNPRGLSAGEVVRIDGREMSHRDFLRQYSDAGELEPIAERLYRSGGLRVDPGDATYENASALAATDGGRSIEESIEGTTDYFAQATRSYVQVGSNHLDAGEAMRKYGTDDMVRIPYGHRSLMEIIYELRTSSEADIYRKYR